MILEKPWLVTLGPLFISHEGRDELRSLACSDMSRPYLDKVWEARGENSVAPPLSNKIAWPYRAGKANVIQFPARGRP